MWEKSFLLIGLSFIFTFCSDRVDQQGIETEISSDTIAPKFERTTILDTLWASVPICINSIHYSDTTRDKIQLIYNRTDTTLIPIFDADQLEDPDHKPLIFYDGDNITATCFIALSDTLSVLAFRTMGMKRPELIIMTQNDNGKLTLYDKKDQILTGQINYVAYFKVSNLFVLHTSGVGQNESGDNRPYRVVVAYSIKDNQFIQQDSFHVPQSDERLFLEGTFSNYRDYYLYVFNQFMRKCHDSKGSKK